MINYDAVNSFIGRAWKYPEFDCYVLVKQAAKAIFDIEISDNIKLTDTPDLQANTNIFNEQKTKPCWVKVQAPSEGNVAMFYDRNKNPVHIGLMIDGFNVLHCFGSLHIKNGKCRYDPISIVSKLYGKIEYYKYIE